MRGSAAHFRVLLVDACGSGAITRGKGGTPAPPFTIGSGEELEGQGVAFLTSSSASEDAQETDELGGSFFSHYFVAALMGAGDNNADERVDLEEAYRYAYAATLRSTSRTWSGTQHPTFRFDFGRQDERRVDRAATTAHPRQPRVAGGARLHRLARFRRWGGRGRHRREPCAQGPASHQRSTRSLLLTCARRRRHAGRVSQRAPG